MYRIIQKTYTTFISHTLHEDEHYINTGAHQNDCLERSEYYVSNTVN